MLILCLRTDQPQAELHLYNDQSSIHSIVWEGHRQLGETLFLQLQELLSITGKKLHEIQGVVCYAGPGSFTGLRIGMSAANALARSYDLPIVGTTGDDWIVEGVSQLCAGQGNTVVFPEYGAPVRITPRRK